MAFMPSTDEMSLAVGISTEGVDKFNDEFSSMANSLFTMRRAVGVAGAALTTLSTVTLIEAINAARRFQSAVSTIEKVATEDVAEGMNSRIREMAQVIPESQEALANLSADAARFGIQGTENIEQFVETSAKMGTATTVSVDEAAEAFARITTLTDTSVQDVDKLGSSINELSNNFATTANEIVDSMLRGGAALDQFGLNQRQIAAVSAALNEVSESSRRAGSRLRRLAQELQSPSKLQSIATGFSEMGISELELADNASVTTSSIRDENDELLRLQNEIRGTNQEITQLQGKHDELGDKITSNMIDIREMRLEAEKQGRELTDSEKEQISELQTANEEMRIEQMKVNQSLDEQREKRQKTQEEIDSQKESVDEAKSAFVDEFRAIMSESPQEALMTLAELMADGGDAADILNESLSTTSRQALSGLGANLDGLNDALQLSNDEWEKGTSLQREFNIESENLNAQLQLLRNNLTNQAIDIGEYLLPAVQGVVEGINRWLDSGDSLINNLSSQQKALTVISGLILGIGGLIFWLVGGPIAIAATAIGFIAMLWADNFMGMRDMTMQFVDRVGQLWEEHRDQVVSTLRRAFGILKGVVQTGLDAITQFWELRGDHIMRIVGRIRNITTRIITRLMGFLIGFIGPMLMRLAGLWDSHGDQIITFVTRFTSLLVAIIGFAIEAVLIVIQATLTVIETVWNKWGDEITTVVHYVFDALVTTFSMMMHVILGVVNGVLALLHGDFKDAGQSFKQVITGPLKELTEFFRRWGIIDAGETVLGRMYDEFVSFKDDVKSLFSGLGSGIAGSLRGAINESLNLPFSHKIGAISVAGEQIFSGKTITIPALAEGGIVTDPTLSMIGEGGPEAVVPLDRLEKLAGGGNEVIVRFEGDGKLVDMVRQTAQIEIQDMNRVQKQDSRSR